MSRRRARADKREETTDAPAPELPITPDMPGKVDDFPRTVDLAPAERAALDQGVTVPGQTTTS
ncbi:hypothetical protein [Streptomyces sp. NPDC005507]|uniref:hypothetical protein n=1 Tax=Streptomyces sp. NPDC005507 TaxID=3154885 RepID=UPI0033ABF47E